MSGFQIFAADAAFQNRAIFYAPNQEKCPIIPRFLPESLRWIRQEAKGSQCAESVVATGQHQMRSERRVCFVLSSPRLPCGRRAKSSVEESGWSIGGKEECQVRLKKRERDYWMGTEIGMLGGYGLQGQVTAGDGSDKQGKRGAGNNNLRRKKKKQKCKVGLRKRAPAPIGLNWQRFYWRFVIF